MTAGQGAIAEAIVPVDWNAGVMPMDACSSPR
jgi:hypothetical protein